MNKILVVAIVMHPTSPCVMLRIKTLYGKTKYELSRFF